jgi:L,D-peptidoglycan transpeptidase YkuD (ErfK/YbiS/YcfS/YnhG family)
MAVDDWVVIADHGGGYALRAGAMLLPAIIGRSGFIRAADKREGDGATPCGRWPVRADSSEYNRHITRPFDFRHEQMWRDDAAYDYVVELGYNDDPVMPGHGSAIFLHCIAVGQISTAGCVAIDRDELARLIGLASANQHLSIPEILLAG